MRKLTIGHLMILVFISGLFSATSFYMLHDCGEDRRGWVENCAKQKTSSLRSDGKWHEDTYANRIRECASAYNDSY